MKRNLILAMFIFMGTVLKAQAPARPLRVVDSLTMQEKANRNPILLRSEVDSLARLHIPVLPSSPIIISKSSTEDVRVPLILLSGIILMLAAWLVYSQTRSQRRLSKMLDAIRDNPVIKNAGSKGKQTRVSLEKRITELNGELFRLTKENDGLNRVIKEYNGIQHEYDFLRHGLQRLYKVKKYPGSEGANDENQAMHAVFNTEASLTAYAYEKFLKPILDITDLHKNNPSKLNEEDQARLMDLLLSLAFLYIEYLYLRVSDLSIGGNMAERIREFSKGKSPDPSLLKNLNREYGSRALVIRMALNRARLDKISYPVFDETNLNQ
jgi:hypothetical protein